MSVCSYIRVYSESYISHLPFGSSQFIDDFQFGNTFYIEAEYFIIESKIDFPIAFAHAGIDNFRGREASLKCSINFASADTVSSKTSLMNDLEKLGVGICLDSIVYDVVAVFVGFGLDLCQCSSQ